MAAVKMILMGIAAMAGCRSPDPKTINSTASNLSPEAILDTIHGDILRGDLRAAQEELNVQRTKFPDKCVNCGERLNLVQAELLNNQGRSADVVKLLCNKTSKPATSQDSAIKKNMYCGLAHFSSGQQELADKELSEAQSVAVHDDSPLLAEVLQTRGTIAVHGSKFAVAEKYFSQSLEIAQKRGYRELEASDLLNLGYSALESEHYGEALDRFNASSAIARSMHASALLQTDLGNIGWAYYQLGDYEVALDKTMQAQQQAKQLEVVFSNALWLKHASLCRQQLGDLAGAETAYKQALGEAENTGNKRLISGVHWGLAFLYLQQGRLAEAKSQADDAHQTAAVSGDKLSDVDATLLQGLIAGRLGNSAEAMHKFNQAYRKSADLPSIQWKIENAIATLTAHSTEPNQAGPWFRKSIATFEAQRNSVKTEELKLPFFTNGDSLYRDYADFLIATHHPDDALKLLDLGRARVLAEGSVRSAPQGRHSKAIVRFDPRAVAASQKATILFYSLGTEKSWLWASDSHRTQLYTLPGRKEIEERVANYQEAILKSSDPVREQNTQAKSLYESIVAPAASMIPAGSKVILIPDGSLNQLNFETLLVPGEHGPHYWIEDVTVSNASSMGLLTTQTATTPETSSRKTLLLVGNPVTAGTDFGALPNAPAEMGTIGKQFSAADSMILSRDAASPSAYAASHPEKYSYIHFVAHGTASLLSPMDSAVVLSPSPAHPDSYKLYARDIVRQPLHADLVTISSCKGSGVRSYAGEGLVGLSWAFLRAGSHNVIGALWNVDDASAPQLMDQLYRGLRSGSSPDVALRNAKLAFIHSAGVHRKPLYWAAFQLYTGS